MADSKNYERSVIKLGNSMAITFPQEWFNKTHLKEHSKVSVFPIDDETILIHKNNYKKGESVIKLDLKDWSSNLFEELILTAFKLSVDKLYLKFEVEKNNKDYYDMVNNLQRKIIGFDSSIISEGNEICIQFLLDLRRISLPEILIELFNIINDFINSVIDKSSVVNQDIYKEKFSRKYNLGLRILLHTLLKYPNLNNVVNRPIVRTLGDRITLLYSKELMDYAFQLKNLPINILDKYSHILKRISVLLLKIVQKYNNIQEKTLFSFQKEIDDINSLFSSSNSENDKEEIIIRRIISKFLSICKDLIGISITRILEAKL
ncbi:MAG: AbrB/MazE/SpoVT family DNA-binding domain-containing protein [Promethearchaeota archaeon]